MSRHALLLGMIGGLLFAGVAWMALSGRTAPPSPDPLEVALGRIASETRALLSATGSEGMAADALRGALGPWLAGRPAPEEAWIRLLEHEDGLLVWGALLARGGPSPRDRATLARLMSLAESGDARIERAALSRLAEGATLTADAEAERRRLLLEDAPGSLPVPVHAALLEGAARSGASADFLLRAALPALREGADPSLQGAACAVLARRPLAEVTWPADLDPPERVAGRLAEIAGTPTNPARESAVVALGRMGAVAAPHVPALIDLLLEGDPTWQGQVTLALIHIGPAAHAAVADRLLADPPLVVALRLLWALRRGGSEAQLARVAAEAPAGIALRATDALGLVRGDADGHAAALSPWLLHEEPEVLLLALAAFARIGAPAAPHAPRIEALTGHEDPMVADAARRAYLAVTMEEGDG